MKELQENTIYQTELTWGIWVKHNYKKIQIFLICLDVKVRDYVGEVVDES